MAQKLKLIAKQIPWSLAGKVGLVCAAAWWRSPALFTVAILLSMLWPLARSMRIVEAAGALLLISFVLPSVGAAWVLVALLAVFLVAIKELATEHETAVRFLEYALVATGLVVFFAQTAPFFSPWTVICATAIAGWLFLILKNETKNHVRAGIAAFVWWQILLGILLLPVSVGIQVFLAYGAFALLAEYQKDQ